MVHRSPGRSPRRSLLPSLRARAGVGGVLVACLAPLACSAGDATSGGPSGGGDTTGGGAEDASVGPDAVGGSGGGGGGSSGGSGGADGAVVRLEGGGGMSSGGVDGGGGRVDGGARPDAGGADAGVARDAGPSANDAGGDAGAGSSSSGGVRDAGCASPPPASPLVGWAAVSGTVTGAVVATTTGGGTAAPTTVTTLAQLNNAARGTAPAVIYVTGNIAGSVSIGSNKTVVGLCGGQITGHVDLSGSVNVIVRNLTVVGFNCTDAAAVSAGQCSSGADAITVVSNAHHIWFDHDDVSDGSDGNLDITQASDFVTVSWTKFHYSTARADLPSGSDSTGAEGHRFSNLIGAADNNPIDVGHLNVTFHHDWWANNVNQRMPRTRYGKIHVFNNLYTATGNSYCIGVGMAANVRNEANAFINVNAPLSEISIDSTSVVSSVGDLYTGAAVAGADIGTAFVPPYAYTAEAASAVQADVQANAGPQ